MNRKEAADILRKLNYIQCTGEPTIDEQMAAVKMAIGCLEYGWNDAALRGPQPDPDCGGKMRIDIPPGNDSVRASPAFQRDGGDKTERRCNQCVICGAEMPEGDQVCGYCRRQHGY